MSYTGFFADDRPVRGRQGRRPGQGHPGWSRSRARRRASTRRGFVERTNPVTGVSEPGPLRAGRRSSSGSRAATASSRASYYTPEVLTRCVVAHALEELLDQDGAHPGRDEILDLTDLRAGPRLRGVPRSRRSTSSPPQYLTRRQEELGRRIDPDGVPGRAAEGEGVPRPAQLYGVDLNATAVELAEISLWLDTMIAGLQAPWFGLHLRRGNSLIGGRRADLRRPTQLAKRGWLTTRADGPPARRGRSRRPRSTTSCCPPHGWGAVADTKEAKEGRPTATAALKAWRRTITGTLTSPEQKRPAGPRAAGRGAVGARAAAAGDRRERDPPPHRRVGRRRPAGGHRRGAARADRGQPDGPEQRVPAAAPGDGRLGRAVVLADHGHVVSPPTRDEWIGALEALLGTMSRSRGARRAGGCSPEI